MVTWWYVDNVIYVRGTVCIAPGWAYVVYPMKGDVR